jgi:hypothetical protein
MDDILCEWIKAVASDARPSERELSEAPCLDRWSFALLDGAGLFMRGTVEGRPVSSEEIVELDACRRWARTASALPLGKTGVDHA